ncbi:MAG: nucleotidyl transferase AbiEii/AbiGii toxin family protein [bacterium]|nr:nucleotidyl transferase AbiEii/AbiGii toxin family protein [bacterium]
MPEPGDALRFRESIDQRLRNRARALQINVTAVRRQAALERLLARLLRVAPDRWALKGGMALDTRLRRARASLDLDADHALGAESARADILQAIALGVGDHFTFSFVGSSMLQEGGMQLAIRYRMDAYLAGRLFEYLQVDVTLHPPEIWETELKMREGLIPELGPLNVPLIPLERQVAEKLHAYSRTYAGGPTTRAKDLVDCVLIRSFDSVDAQRLRSEVARTFAARNTHAVPSRLPPPPPALRASFRALAAEVGIDPDLQAGYRLAAGWLDSVLSGEARGRWDPDVGAWSEME